MPRASKAAGKKKRVLEDLPAFDSSRFVSLTAEQAFPGQTRRKVTHQKGFTHHDSNDDIWQLIRQRQWNHWCGCPGYASMTLVQEFYANACGNMEGLRPQVTVRNTCIELSARVIYEVLRIPRDSRSSAERDADIALSMEEIGIALCGHAPRWTYARQARPSYFDASELTVTAKAWLTFICSSLAPSSNPFRVTRDRCLILYRILHGKPVDIASPIIHSITQAANDPTKRIVFPELITAILSHYGVTFCDDPHGKRGGAKVITCSLISKARTPGHIDPPSSEEEDGHAHAPTPPGPPPSDYPGLLSAFQSHVDAGFASLQSSMDAQFTALRSDMMAQHESHQQQMDTLEVRIRETATYNAAAANAVNDNLLWMHQQSRMGGTPPRTFPRLPSHLAYYAATSSSAGAPPAP